MSITPANLDVSISGSGPSLVFTHGWTDDKTTWDGVVENLGNDYTCLSWSLRGHGQSEAPGPGTYSREHGLADMASVIAQVDTPTVLVGHSLGGYLSLAHTINHPDTVRALILVGAGPGFSKPEAMDQWNESVDKAAAKIGVPEGAEVLSKHFDSFVLDNMASITVPTLVVLGEKDKQFAASAGVFKKKLDVRADVVVSDAGHSVQKHQPAAVADAIADFLTSL